jgi:hypothetical protein
MARVSPSQGRGATDHGENDSITAHSFCKLTRSLTCILLSASLVEFMQTKDVDEGYLRMGNERDTLFANLSS